MYGGDAGAHRSLADDELPFARNERSVAYFNSFNVCDGVVGAGGAVEGDAEVAGAGLSLG
jgi:hypothetical protein